MADRTAVPSAAFSAKLVDAWLAGHASEHTRSAYRIDLNTFGRWCAQRTAIPLTVDTADLVAFGTDRLEAGDSDATMRRRWSSLSSFYQYAVDAGSLITNPVDGISRPVDREVAFDVDVLSAAAVDAYLEMATALDPRLGALVSLIVLDGVKLGEALALDTDDIRGRPPKTSATIRRNGKTRTVVLSDLTARAVRRCVAKRRDQPLFTSERRAQPQPPKRLSRFGADHLIRQLRGSDDERVTANELRRFYITSNHRSGATIEELRNNAGLSDSRGIFRYLEGSR